MTATCRRPCAAVAIPGSTCATGESKRRHARLFSGQVERNGRQSGASAQQAAVVLLHGWSQHKPFLLSPGWAREWRDALPPFLGRLRRFVDTAAIANSFLFPSFPHSCFWLRMLLHVRTLHRDFHGFILSFFGFAACDWSCHFNQFYRPFTGARIHAIPARRPIRSTSEYKPTSYTFLT